ncbi:MAG: hypothetical protein AAF391_04610 [Bacteroidota bacterium]
MIKLIWLLVVTYSFKVGAQEELSPTITIVPPSPEVMAMNKHIEIPVSYYTGLPQINIPIMNIGMNNIQIPISLDYHASGLRVSEYASSVGAGWSLSGGGVISRTIKGKADERYEQTFQGYFYADNWLQSSGEPIISVISDCSLNPVFTFDDEGSAEYATPVNPSDFLAQGWWDSQPDEYHFSLPGGPSGKFMFTHEQDLIMLTPSDIEIVSHPFQFQVSAGTYLSDYYWKIRDANGTTYTFEYLAEKTTSSNICANVTQLSIETVPVIDHVYEDNQTSWFLTKIENGSEWVTFGYGTERIIEEYNTASTFKHKIEGSDPSSETQCITNATRDTYRLTSINSSSGQNLVIEYGDEREDLRGSHRMRRLVSRFGGEPIKVIDLDNDHYFSDSTKLKLEKVVVQGVNAADYPLTPIEATNVDTLYSYTLEYFENSQGDFPAHNTPEQDYWGFYNGAIANSNSVLPEWWNDDYHINENSTTDRNPNLEKTKLGTLKKIIYPTGGSAEFDYELHDYSGPNTYEQHVYSVFADGDINTTAYDTVQFTVNQNCSISIFKPQFPQNGAGLDVAYYLEKWNDSINDWQLYIPSARPGQQGITVAFRQNIEVGQYRLRAESWGSPIQIVVKFEEDGNVSFQRAGGLRIKKITHSDPLTTSTTNSIFEYTLDGELRSSGKLFSSPINDGYITKFAKALTNEDRTYCQTDVPTFYMNLASYVQLPLATVSGSHVGYSRVAVHKVSQEVLDNHVLQPNIGYVPDYAGFTPEFTSGSNHIGFTAFEYLNDYAPVVEYNSAYPYIPYPKVDFVNGSLAKKQIFKSDSVYSNTFNKYVHQPVLQRETINQYDTLEVNSIKSYIYRKFYSTNCYTCSYNDMYINSYTNFSRKVRLKKTIDKTIENGIELQNETLYNYNYPINHELLSSVSILDAGNGAIPEDAVTTVYVRDATYPKLIKQIIRHRNEILISSEKIDRVGNLPHKYYQQRKDSTGFELIKTIDWDDGFPVHVVEGSDLSEVSYLYNRNLVVAAVSNIEMTELVAKLSLVNPVGSVTTSWLKSQTDPVTIKSVLDQLRDLLDDDQFMTTYIYEEGRLGYGPVAIIDPNGLSQKFEYDSFGRLSKVLDHEDNILKKVEYTYTNQ